MPADSRALEEEGVVIPPTRVEDGDAGGARRRRCALPTSASPTCAPSAPPTGSASCASRELAERHGLDRLRAGMDEILAYAERRTRAALAALPDGTYEAEDVLEDDAGGEPRDVVLRVAATIAGDRLTLDFAGTDPQVEGNLNCPLSVTKSAAFFAVRVLTDPDAPPSAGAYRPIEVVAPEGCLLNARFPAAVAAGNVETSSRVADLVIAALGGAAPVPAQGQGTMNNLTLANEGFTYYETIGGGQGACPDADGPSAIHVAMSNTLNTPVEALETEFPLRVRELALRRGSGGEGGSAAARNRARDRGAGADALHADRRAPPPRAARPRRRRGRRPGAQSAQRRAAAEQGRRGAAARRQAADRDPRRRRHSAKSLNRREIFAFSPSSSRMPGFGGASALTGSEAPPPQSQSPTTFSGTDSYADRVKGMGSNRARPR